MKISHVRLEHFKRFTDLTISGLPSTAHLIVLAGPNGSGKSSLFDAFIMWHRAHSGGWHDDHGYYRKGTTVTTGTLKRITLTFFGNEPSREEIAKGFYARTASNPTRAFWASVLSVALDDVAALVAPKEIVVCEGSPKGAVPGKNAEHDAICYDTIFSDEFPDVKFLSAGNASDVASDRLGFVAALPKVASGITVRRLIDRDDHAPADIAGFNAKGISVLPRRHIECYLYDDEVLTELCNSVGKPAEAAALIAEKNQAIVDSVSRKNPPDDVKSAARDIYLKAKARLKLTGVGNDQLAFARSTLAPLIKRHLKVYQDLKVAIFGP
jgi:ABC-type cobalamin/Fe3+-siderophores transport system ATPase subunit